MQIRSLALPFTVIEWTLPTAPRPGQSAQSRQSTVGSEESATGAQGGTSSPKPSSPDSSEQSTFDSLTRKFHSHLCSYKQFYAQF